MAQALLERMLAQRGAAEAIRVRSGGIGGNARDGMIPSLDARIVLREAGIDLAEDAITSTDLRRHRELLTAADLILTMTAEQKTLVGAVAGTPGAPVFTLTPTEEQELEQRALLIVRAMVNAAKADGQIDGQEIERISAKLGEAGSDQEARAFLAQELQKPIDSDAITRQVSDPQLAVQVYAASLLAIEVDTAAERAYLRDLAARLGLDASAVAHVHQALGVAAPA